jgi:hypothetical protein
LKKQLPQPRTPEEARKIVDRQLQDGTDITKLFTGSLLTPDKVMLMPEGVAAAAAAATHAPGKLVFAHPSSVAGLDVALAAKVDLLAHAVEHTQGMTPEHLRRMKRQNMALVPTLALYQPWAAAVWSGQQRQLRDGLFVKLGLQLRAVLRPEQGLCGRLHAGQLDVRREPILRHSRPMRADAVIGRRWRFCVSARAAQCNVQCPGSATTTITGKVYDPAGKSPLYHVAVYVPANPLTPLPAGVPTGADACSCPALYKSGAIVSTSTEDGT